MFEPLKHQRGGATASKSNESYAAYTDSSGDNTGFERIVLELQQKYRCDTYVTICSMAPIRARIVSRRHPGMWFFEADASKSISVKRPREDRRDIWI